MKLKFPKLPLGIVRAALKAFGPVFEGQRSGIVLGMVISVLIAGLQVLRPLPIKLIFDHVVEGRSRHAARHPFLGLDADTTLVISCVSILLISAIGGWLAVWQAVVLARVGRSVATRIRKKVFEHMHRLALPFHQSTRTGDLIVRLMGDVNNVRDLLFGSWVNLAGGAVVFLGTGAVMIWLDPVLGLIALLPFPLLFLKIGSSSRRLTVITKKQRKKEGGAASFAGETLRQIRVVKAYAAESRSATLFGREARSSERAGGEAARLAAKMERSGELLTGVGLAVMVFLGAQKAIAKQITAGDLAVLFTYARSLYKPLRSFSKEGTRVSKAAACAERLTRLLNTPAEEIGVGTSAPPFEGRVTFDNVGLVYAGGTKALDGFDATIGPGELAVISGPNGAGKSTAISVLLRLLVPDSGTVAIDGTPIGAFELESYRERFAYVPQDISLFSGSVRDNILFGKPDATPAEVEAAAEAAHAFRFIIDDLPRGFGTVLGEGGTMVSGGQARRIMLARAALRNARILLLDEPLAGLDVTARRDVARAIRSIAAGRTTIVISHESIDDLAPDVIFRLDAGRVAEAIRPPAAEPIP